MQKYSVRPSDIHLSDGDCCKMVCTRVYRASEVDARIAELEMGLRAIIGEVNGCGPKCSDEFKRIALDSIRGIATRTL